MQLVRSHWHVFAGTLIGLALFFWTYITYMPAALTKRTETITLKCTVLDQKQCIERLGKNAKKAAFKALDITIINHTNRNLAFSVNDLNLQAISPRTAAKRGYYNTTGRAIGWSVGGLLFPIVWIPGIIHYASGVNANQKFMETVTKNGLTEHCIWTGNTLKGMIFVDSNEQQNCLKFAFTDTATGQKIICAVDLTKNADYLYTV